MPHPYPDQERKPIEELHQFADHGNEYVHLLECRVRELEDHLPEDARDRAQIREGEGGA